jgi:putative PIN family toxin of toxin-antitoxin system
VIRAVIDANVVVSAMLVAGSVPWQVVKAAGTRYVLVWSPAVVEECIRVAAYPKLRARFSASDPSGFLRELTEIATLISGELPRVGAVRADPSDDVYLATALAGAAPFLVTGDRKHLLALREFAGVRIVTPAAFLRELGVV